VAPQQPMESAETKQLKAQLQNLQKQIDEEKAKREAEKKEEERLRKVEEHRRRLYPEYYSRQESPVEKQPYVRPITTVPPPPANKNVQPEFVRPITTLPAAKPQAPAANDGFVRPITSLDSVQTSQIKDKELQSLVQNAKPKKSPDKVLAPQAPSLPPAAQKSETLKVGDGVEMILPM
jgi:hypothetical protein